MFTKEEAFALFAEVTRDIEINIQWNHLKGLKIEEHYDCLYEIYLGLHYRFFEDVVGKISNVKNSILFENNRKQRIPHNSNPLMERNMYVTAYWITYITYLYVKTRDPEFDLDDYTLNKYSFNGIKTDIENDTKGALDDNKRIFVIDGARTFAMINNSDLDALLNILDPETRVCTDVEINAFHENMLSIMYRAEFTLNIDSNVHKYFVELLFEEIYLDIKQQIEIVYPEVEVSCLYKRVDKLFITTSGNLNKYFVFEKIIKDKILLRKYGLRVNTNTSGILTQDNVGEFYSRKQSRRSVISTPTQHYKN